MTPWSRICISHADCILLVGAQDASPQACAHSCYKGSSAGGWTAVPVFW